MNKQELEEIIKDKAKLGMKPDVITLNSIDFWESQGYDSESLSNVLCTNIDKLFEPYIMYNVCINIGTEFKITLPVNDFSDKDPLFVIKNLIAAYRKNDNAVCRMFLNEETFCNAIPTESEDGYIFIDGVLVDMDLDPDISIRLCVDVGGYMAEYDINMFFEFGLWKTQETNCIYYKITDL